MTKSTLHSERHPVIPGHHGEGVEATLVQHLPLDGGDEGGGGGDTHHISGGVRHPNVFIIICKSM